MVKSKLQFEKILLLVAVLTSLIFSSCINKVVVSLNLKNKNTSTDTLNWNYANLVVLPGEDIPFSITNGVPPYVTNANGVGSFNLTTLLYSAPINIPSRNHSISLVDSTSQTGTNYFKIAAFQNGSKMQFPQTFGDQNYVTSAATTTNNDIYISSIVSDSPGWERWVIFKTANNGTTWNKVDQYVPYEDGESHPLSLIAKNNDIYACGYIYGGALYNSEWIVRKSTNGGVTWNNVDEYHATLGTNHVCYDIDLDSTTGHLFTSGYDNDGFSNRGIIRESTDDGATWSTIATVAGRLFFSIKISPLGIIWAMADNGVIYKGTYSLGSWNWTTAGTLATGPVSSGMYELRGSLEIIDENTAIYSTTDTQWRINKTSDAGTTWTNTYSDGPVSTGQEVIKLSNGDLMSTGRGGTSPSAFKVIKSSDNGNTWSTSYTDNVMNKEAHTLLEANDGSILALGNYNGNPRQIIGIRSTNFGTSWLSISDVFYKEQLYTYYKDFKVDGLGNFWATSWSYNIDSNFTSPWNLIKSSDNGLTWSNSDLFTDTISDLNSEKIAIGPNNEVYVSGYKNTLFILRKSTNQGATWSQVDSYTSAGATNNMNSFISVAPNGDVYYAGTAATAGNRVSEIRKGSSNGTIWNSIQTFPIAAGSTLFNLRDLKVFSDGSIWVIGYEKNASVVDQNVIYSSIDNGATFVEKYRVNGSTIGKILKDNTGKIYVISNDDVITSTDNGSTWSTYYSNATNGAAYNFVITSTNKINLKKDFNQVMTKNQFSNNWFITFDYSTYNSLSGNSLSDIVNCGSISEICLIGHYDISTEGSVHRLIPLVTP